MSRSAFFAISIVVAACVTTTDDDDTAGPSYAGSLPETEEGGEDGGGEGSGSGSGEGSGTTSLEPSDLGPAEGIQLSTGCSPYGSDVYTPYVGLGPVSSGTPAGHPWVGPSSYPETVEDFRGYGPALPATVECGANKSARDHLDVTAGCLQAVSVEGDTSGKIQLTADGYYRSFALAYDAEHGRRVAWDDQAVEYSFKYAAWTGEEGNPGFKAFGRYMTEYDLYVASWRKDGVVQIQKKQCGVYTILARNPSFGAPSPDVWHTMRFEVVGDEQRLYLDGELAMTTHDDAIKNGTAGIRIDSANGALIDDWRVEAP